MNYPSVTIFLILVFITPSGGMSGLRFAHPSQAHAGRFRLFEPGHALAGEGHVRERAGRFRGPWGASFQVPASNQSFFMTQVPPSPVLRHTPFP